MRKARFIPFLAAIAVASCASVPDWANVSNWFGANDQAEAAAMMRTSFKASGQAKLDRLDQDEAQRICSDVAASKKPISTAAGRRLEEANLRLIKQPADGRYLGDWREGEKIAQSGVGKQFSDDPAVPAGANCYACHQLTKSELSFGTIGPSLYNFGKIRGDTEPIVRYTWGKIYNAQAYSACSTMPRFGHNGILTEQQMKHLVSLLLDPASPVNR